MSFRSKLIRAVANACRDAGRIDVRLDADGKVQFIELNPLAGIHPEHSDLPIMASKIGMGYTTLIGMIMNSAMQRVAVRDRAETIAA